LIKVAELRLVPMAEKMPELSSKLIMILIFMIIINLPN
jgi:hypothetical protein